MKKLITLAVILLVSCSPDDNNVEPIEQTCYTLVEVIGLDCLTDNQQVGVRVRYESEDGQNLFECFYPPEQAENNIGSIKCITE